MEEPHGVTPLQRAVDPLRLRLVVEVDRRGSITRAAEACGIGQPMASTHLRALEAVAGQRLFERAGRATRLTDAGRCFARQASIVLSTLDALEQELAALRGGRAGSLRIAMSDDFGNYVLPRVLARFGEERPHVGLEVRIARSGEVLRAVASGDAQFGVAGETRRVPGLVTEWLLQDEIVLIGPPDLGPTLSLVTPDELEEMTLVVSSRESSTRALSERLLASVHTRPARCVELGSVEAVKRAVRSGLGVAFVSRLAIADELARGELHTLRIRGAAPVHRRLEIVRRQSDKPTPLQQAFEHTLRAVCGAAETARTPRAAAQ